MGGNALKPFEVRRFDKKEYSQIWDELYPIIQKYFLYTQHTESIHEKKDFGDMDIVVAVCLDDGWKEKFSKDIGTKAQVSNSNVHSFEYKGIQIDLIHIPGSIKEFKWATIYLSNNDLGNLIGRLARHIGFTYGSQGFTYQFNQDNGSYTQEIVVSFEKHKVAQFLGFTYLHEDFPTFKHMFKWLTTSCLFDPTIYLLENRNQEGRHRDKKRPNYLAFLEFCHKRFDINKLTYQPANKKVHLLRAFDQWPEFKRQYLQAKKEAALSKRIKRAFNGNLVKKVTKLSGKELGDFIKANKALFQLPENYSMDLNSRTKLIHERYDYFMRGSEYC